MDFNMDVLRFKKGYLISFEGHDSTGKTTLLHEVSNHLRIKGYSTATVAEFSDSFIGNQIRHLLESCKFFRLQIEEIQSAFTETMYLAADLYYQDEHQIRPAIDSGKIVLKERHVDSLLACQIVRIKHCYPQYEIVKLQEWIADIASHLYLPDITFLLTLPDDILVSRISERGETVSKEDLGVFAKREEMYQQLCATFADRIIKFDNNRPKEDAAKEIVHILLDSLSL